MVDDRRGDESTPESPRTIASRLDSLRATEVLDALFGVIRDFLFVIDERGRILAVNRTVEERLGYSAEELRGRSVLVVHPPELQEEAQEVLADLVAGRRAFCTIPLLARDGRRIPVETSVSKGCLHGAPCLIGVSRDVTERERTDEERKTAITEMERAHGRLSLLLEAAPRVQAATTERAVLEVVAPAVRDTGWAAVAAHLYSDWEPVDAVYVGLSEEEIAILEDSRPDRAERASRFGASRERFKVSRSYFIPAEARASIGMPVPPRLSGRPRTDGRTWDPADTAYIPMYGPGGEVIGAIAMDDPVDGLRPDEEKFRYLEFFAELAAATIAKIRLEDDRRQAEQDLQDSESRLRALSDASFEAIFMSKDGICIDQNQTAEQAFGYTLEEAIGRPITDWIAPQDRDRARRDIRAERRGPYEAHAMRKDGSTFPALIRARVIDYEGSRVRVTSLVDITERKKAEEELRKSEELLALALDATCDGVWEHRLPEDVWTRTEAWYELTGYARGELEAWEAEHGSFIHPDDVPEMKRSMLAHLEGRTPEYRAEFRIRHKSGEWRWFLGRGRTMVRHEDGTSRRLIGTDTDITPLKRVEEALRVSERRYRSLIESANDAILVADAETEIILDANRGAERLLGRPLAEIIGLHQSKLHPPERVEEYRRIFRSHVESDRVVTQRLLVRHEDGHDIPVSISAVLTELEGRSVLQGIFRDETEQQRMEEELRRSEQKYRGLFDDSIAAVYVFDGEKRFVDSNQAGLDLLGYTREELLSMSIPDVDADPVMVLPAHRQLLSGEPIVNYQHRLKRKDGRIITVLNNSCPLTAPSGEVTGMQSTLIDITQEIRLEEELRQLQKLEAIGTLAAGVAHDFNNILTAIIGHAELIRLSVNEVGQPGEEIDGIIAAAQRGAGVARSLLTFCRKTPPKLVTVDFGRLIADSTSMLRRVLPAIIEMETSGLESDRWWIDADAVQISQVLMNLVVNSRDAMPEGGTIRISIDEGELARGDGPQEVAQADRMAVVLTVEDTGYGIDSEYIQRVCDPFFTTKPRGQGTGLGLSVVHGIVETHGAHLALDSESGRGTTVRIRFPAKSRPDIRDEEVEEAADMAAFEGTVLLADDDAQVRRVLAGGLKEAGCRVLEACDGRQAVQIHQEVRDVIDLVVLDIDMPRLDGPGCVAKMRATHPELPVILISGLPQSASVAAVLSGARLLRKPFTITQLVRVVEELLEGNRKRSVASPAPPSGR